MLYHLYTLDRMQVYVREYIKKFIPDRFHKQTQLMRLQKISHHSRDFLKNNLKRIPKHLHQINRQIK